VLCLAACQSGREEEAEAEKEAVKLEAKRFLVTFAVPSSETEQLWGMKDFTAIGWGGIFHNVLETAVESAEINRIGGTRSYELVVRFWSKGTSLSGEPLKLRRTLYLKASTPDGGASWQIESPEFRNDEPLTFLRQLSWWLLCTFVILPVLFGVGLLLFSAMLGLEKAGCFLSSFAGWGALILVYGAPLFLPAIFAYSFFDSWVFSGICLLLSLPLMRAIANAMPDTQ
jgi:hypothetical protein